MRRKNYTVIFILFFGVFFRFLLMAFGWNFDFESYKIVGELAASMSNVYAWTGRYNYGPCMFILMGICYKLSVSVYSMDPMVIYRTLLVGILIFTDLGIACWIYQHFGLKSAILFFLNPVVIFITGYHNQFDNISILFILLSIDFYNEESKFSKRDIYFVLLFSLSLIVKHDFYALPLWILLRRELPWKKKCLYTFCPPLIFLLSFLPFYLQNPLAAQGIKNNVFLYKSNNNAPLLKGIFELIHIDNSLLIVAFFLMMCFCGVMVRKLSLRNSVLLYLLCLVAFSSSITNQYLTIPVAALCTIVGVPCLIAYSVWIIPYLLVNGNGLDIQEKISELSVFDNEQLIFSGVTVILVISIICVIMRSRRDSNQNWKIGENNAKG